MQSDPKTVLPTCQSCQKRSAVTRAPIANGRSMQWRCQICLDLKNPHRRKK